MDWFLGLTWIFLSAMLFGSQFIPAKYCPKFRSSAYNVSMAFGIIVGSVISFVLLGMAQVQVGLIPLSILGGGLWVAGNYLLIVAVAKAGMARAFCIINFSSVISFIGGAVFLGEMEGFTGTKVAILAGAVGLVLVGSILVTTTTPSEKSDKKGRATVMSGLIASFVSTLFFSGFNIIIGWVVNGAGVAPGAAFVSFSPGILIGAVVIAAIPFEKGLSAWRKAPPFWHRLAVVQGLIWSAAMVSVMYGWIGVGISIGTPVQVGTQTIVSAVWGILMFNEFKGLKDKGAAYGRFAIGVVLTITGITVMAVL